MIAGDNVAIALRMGKFSAKSTETKNPHQIVAAWRFTGTLISLDTYSVDDTPETRAIMQNWCDSMNSKYGAGIYFIFSFNKEDKKWHK